MTLCDTKTLKVIAGLIIFFYIIASLVMMGFGVGLKVAPYKHVDPYSSIIHHIMTLSGPVTQAIPIFMIVMGVLSALSGMFCLAAVFTEHTHTLRLNIFIFVILILGNIALISLAACYPTGDQLKENMWNTRITNFGTQDIKIKDSLIEDFPEEKFANSWTSIQIEAKCCGVNGPLDYLALPFLNRTETIFPELDPMVIMVPLSCCYTSRNDLDNWVIEDLNACISHHPSSVHTKGCMEVVNAFYILLELPVYRLAPILIIFQVVLLMVCLKLLTNTYEQIK